MQSEKYIHKTCCPKRQRKMGNKKNVQSNLNGFFGAGDGIHPLCGCTAQRPKGFTFRFPFRTLSLKNLPFRQLFLTAPSPLRVQIPTKKIRQHAKAYHLILELVEGFEPSAY